MNGTPSTDNSDGFQPGDAGDAGSTARRTRLDAICDAWLALEESAQGDVDLSRAQEKITEWLARTGTWSDPKSRAVR